MVEQPDTLESLKLDAEGRWLVDGEEITHARTVALLHRGIERTGTTYGVRVGAHSRPIEIEDTARFVTGINWDTQGGAKTGCMLSLSDGSTQRLAPQTLSYRPGRLTCLVKAPWGDCEAKFLRPAYHEFLKEADDDPSGYSIVVDGFKVLLARKPGSH